MNQQESEYRIALVNNANPSAARAQTEAGKTATHIGQDVQWLVCRSKRRTRAIEQARHLLSGTEQVFRRVEGRGDVRVSTANIMLFHFHEGKQLPVSLRQKHLNLQRGARPVGER